MLDIYSLVQEFWSTSSDGAVGVPFFPMRCLLEILEVCSLFFLRVPSNQLIKNLQMLANPISEWPFDDVIITQVKKMFRRMFDQSLSKSKALGDMLRLLPGVAVQRHMSMQGMAVFTGLNWSYWSD